jgi:nucleoside-diphosphate-sugar epimerase
LANAEISDSTQLIIISTQLIINSPMSALNHKTILITGSAGFIGANLVKRLFKEMSEGTIIGLDNLNNYYDVSLKEYRLKELDTYYSQLIHSPLPLNSKPSTLNYKFVRGSIADKELVNNLFAENKFDIVVNLAAQAGVRYSIENPDAYIESNILGFYNILEACRHSKDVIAGEDPQSHAYKGVQHLVYASSSSVYGGNTKVPFSTDDNVDHPVSLYAATKKSNKLLKGEIIQIYNYGNCRRDFTYVDDIVEGVVRVMKKAPKTKVPETVPKLVEGPVEGPTTTLSTAPYAIYNIGGGQPENLLDFVQILQEELVRAGVLPKDYDFEAHKQLVPMQPGDVPTTYADATALERDFGFVPKITLREGLRRFAEWYKRYYM